MTRKLLLVLFIAAAIAGCKSPDAFKYSQDFVKKENSLKDDIYKTENDVARYIAAGQFDSVSVAGARMEKIADAKLQEVKNEPAPDVKEAEHFKQAGIRYFSFIKSMYTGYKDYGAAKDETAREAELEKLKQIIMKKESVINEMQDAQKTYAAANNFKLQGTK